MSYHYYFLKKTSLKPVLEGASLKRDAFSGFWGKTFLSVYKGNRKLMKKEMGKKEMGRGLPSSGRRMPTASLCRRFSLAHQLAECVTGCVLLAMRQHF